jgi:hypothetical protein
MYRLIFELHFAEAHWCKLEDTCNVMQNGGAAF